MIPAFAWGASGSSGSRTDAVPGNRVLRVRAVSKDELMARGLLIQRPAQRRGQKDECPLQMLLGGAGDDEDSPLDSLDEVCKTFVCSALEGSLIVEPEPEISPARTEALKGWSIAQSLRSAFSEVKLFGWRSCAPTVSRLTAVGDDQQLSVYGSRASTAEPDAEDVALVLEAKLEGDDCDGEEVVEVICSARSLARDFEFAADEDGDLYVWPKSQKDVAALCDGVSAEFDASKAAASKSPVSAISGHPVLAAAACGVAVLGIAAFAAMRLRRS